MSIKDSSWRLHASGGLSLMCIYASLFSQRAWPELSESTSALYAGEVRCELDRMCVIRLSLCSVSSPNESCACIFGECECLFSMSPHSTDSDLQDFQRQRERESSFGSSIGSRSWASRSRFPTFTSILRTVIQDNATFWPVVLKNSQTKKPSQHYLLHSLPFYLVRIHEQRTDTILGGQWWLAQPDMNGT